jgi:hypothetical protein
VWCSQLLSSDDGCVFSCLCRPSHALYFASYEAAKQLFGGNQEGHHPLATAAAGATATIVNDGCMNPWDVVKQRMQVRLAGSTGAAGPCRAGGRRDEGSLGKYWCASSGCNHVADQTRPKPSPSNRSSLHVLLLPSRFHR